MTTRPSLSGALRACLIPLGLLLGGCVYTDIDPGYGSYGAPRSYGGYGGGYNYGYTSYNPWRTSYYRAGYCNICRHNPCTCDHRRRDSHDHDHDRDHDDHDSHHSENAYRIAGGSTGSKDRPSGYHSPGWYESRGYDTDRLRLQNESGQVYRSGSGSSSSNKSSSGSSRSSHDHDRDNNRPSSHSSSSSRDRDNLNQNNPHLQQRGDVKSGNSHGNDRDGDKKKRD